MYDTTMIRKSFKESQTIQTLPTSLQDLIWDALYDLALTGKEISDTKIEGLRTELSKLKGNTIVLDIATTIQKQLRQVDPFTNYVDMLSGPNVSTLFLTSSTFSMPGKLGELKKMHTRILPDVTDTADGSLMTVDLNDLQSAYKKWWGKSLYPHIWSVQIMTHGNLLDNLPQGARIYDNDKKQYATIQIEPQHVNLKSEQNMVFTFQDNKAIKASDLFRMIRDKMTTQSISEKEPLFVVTIACHGGQARNDVQSLGKNAMLLTFVGRKHTTRMQNNINEVLYDSKKYYIHDRLKKEVNYMGPFQWMKNCVLGGVSFNVSLTDDEARKILWMKNRPYYIEGIKAISVKQYEQDKIVAMQINEQISTQLKNSIKGGLELGTLFGQFADNIKNNEDMFTAFQHYSKEQYTILVDSIPLSTVKSLGYKNHDEVKALWCDVSITKMDAYKHLFTTLATAVDYDTKDVGQLLDVISDENHHVNKCLQRLIGLKLSDRELYNLLLPQNAQQFLSTLRNVNTQKLLEEFINLDKNDPQHTKKFYALCSSCGFIPENAYAALLHYATDLSVDKIQALRAPDATQLGAEEEGEKYSLLCASAKNLSVNHITVLCSAEAQFLEPSRYQFLLKNAANLSANKVRTLCSLNTQLLDLPSYGILCKCAQQLDDYKMQILCSIEAQLLSNEKYRLLCNAATNLKAEEIKALCSRGHSTSLDDKQYQTLLTPNSISNTGDNLSQEDVKLLCQKKENRFKELEALQIKVDQLQKQIKERALSIEKGQKELEEESDLLQTKLKSRLAQNVSISTQHKQENSKEQNQQNNLRRWGKEQGEGEMMEELKDYGKSGKMELMGEVHDQHGASVRKLVERMERGEMGAGTVVALERKEGGEHLGMRDVRLLAEVLRHNEGCRKDEERVALPAGIEGTAMWWDAKLVNAAQKHGVQVIGVEGKGLAHDQRSPEYNADREDHMAQQIHQLRRQGYDVVLPVGEAHVKGLQARLREEAAMEAMQSMMQRSSAPIGQDKGQRVSQHPATIDVKKTYGKFTAQSARGSSNNRGIM